DEARAEREPEQHERERAAALHEHRERPRPAERAQERPALPDAEQEAHPGGGHGERRRDGLLGRLVDHAERDRADDHAEQEVLRPRDEAVAAAARERRARDERGDHQPDERDGSRHFVRSYRPPSAISAAASAWAMAASACARPERASKRATR